MTLRIFSCPPNRLSYYLALIQLFVSLVNINFYVAFRYGLGRGALPFGNYRLNIDEDERLMLYGRKWRKGIQFVLEAHHALVL